MTYDFKCPKCGLEVEVIFGTFAEYESTKDNQICPACKRNTKMVRNYKPVNIKFEGPGFYSTDNRKT